MLRQLSEKRRKRRRGRLGDENLKTKQWHLINSAVQTLDSPAGSLHNNKWPIITVSSSTPNVGPLPSSLALPSREISHLLSNCTTRSWTHQTHYSLIITLKSLHRCALYPPQLILPSLYTFAPCDPCTDLSALCQASRRGEGYFGSRETGSPSQVSLASPDESSIYSVSSPEWLSHKHSHEGSTQRSWKRLNDIWMWERIYSKCKHVWSGVCYLAVCRGCFLGSHCLVFLHVCHASPRSLTDTHLRVLTLSILFQVDGCDENKRPWARVDLLYASCLLSDSLFVSEGPAAAPVSVVLIETSNVKPIKCVRWLRDTSQHP